ncbi:hypothetical protein BKH41_03455 [Helicobacter sp. 12S02232-10]|uniref:DUF1090 family protein n=1 Tax=Helicobacter sp. 12S02232-10 TaxID=1476197 RepID=UPI000BA68310|nr:DUF1090 family protein [Helicobacter sp. 12S02232-10]PAF49151.1 hypothetical protein BKH41_03455 [Helicobacter sp. 12S02232-10]
MSKYFFIFSLLFVLGYGGPICDFKINNVSSQIDYALKKNPNQNLSELKKNLQELEKNCKDSDVLKDINQNIEMTQNNLEQAKINLSDAQIKGNIHQIRQAQIDLKIANLQYIAAKQELLRMKDLLKENKK